MVTHLLLLKTSGIKCHCNLNLKFVCVSVQYNKGGSEILRFVNTAKGIKGKYTIGHCQRPVFSLGVSQHMHTITNL